MPNKNVISETVVSLSADIDNAGMQKLFNLMDTNKLKAYTLAASLAAVTTGVYKMIKGFADEANELQNLSKQQGKSIQQTVAEKKALDAMGKSLSEIQKDGNLKKTYEELVKFNKELATPNYQRTIDNMNKLQTAIYKLKSVLSYSLMQIGEKVFTNLTGPMQEVGDKLTQFTNWVKNNMNLITSKIAVGISDFVKGLKGIVQLFENIGTMLGKLPNAIKGVGLAIAAVWAFINAGPLGQILSIVTMLGDFFQDYDNYQWNKRNQQREDKYYAADNEEGYTKDINEALKENGEPIVYKIPVAFDWAWETVDSDLTPEEKAGKIATDAIGRLTEALDGAFNDFDMGKVFGDGTENNGGLIGAIKRWFDNEDNKKLLSELGDSIIGFFTRGIKEVGGFAGGAAAKIFDAIFGDGTIDEDLYKGDGSAGATFAGGIAGFFVGFAEELQKPDSSVWKAFKEGMKDFSLGSVITAFLANIQKDETGQYAIDWAGIGTDLETVGNSILGIFTEGIKAAASTGTTLLEIIGEAISGTHFTGLSGIDNFVSSLGDTFKLWASDETLMSGITTAVTTLFSGGSLFESVLTGIFGSYTSARDDAMKKAIRDSGKYSGDEELLGNLDYLPSSTLTKLFNSLTDEQKAGYNTALFSNLGTAAGSFISGIWDTILSAVVGSSDLGAELVGKLFDAIGSLLGIGIDTSKMKDGNVVAGGVATAIGVKLAGGGFLTSIVAGLLSAITTARERIEGDQTLWDILEQDAKDIWDMILDIWEGPIDEVTGERKGDLGLSSIFKKLFGGGDGGKGLAEQVLEWLAPVGDAIVAFFNSLWIRIYNSGPKWLRDAFGFAGIEDPNTSTIGKDNEGNYYIESTNKNKRPLTQQEYDWLTSQTQYKILDENGKPTGQYNLSVDKDGNIVGTNGLTYTEGNIEGKMLVDSNLDAAEMARMVSDYHLSNDDGLSEEESVSLEQAITHLENTTKTISTMNDDEKKQFNADYDLLKSYFDKFGLGGEPSGENKEEEIPTEGINKLNDESASVGDNLREVGNSATATEGSINHFNEMVDLGGAKAEGFGDRVKGAGLEFAKNAGGLNSGVSIATSAMDNLAGSASSAAGALASIGKENGGKAAYGGRFSSERRGMTVGEDGTEYIIPITKPERAFSLINQMLSEMGSSAIQRVMEGFGLGGENTIGATTASVGTAMQGMTMANTYNISAPVSINVNSSGTSAEAIGTSIYDAAERHIMKTLRGVCA